MFERVLCVSMRLILELCFESSKGILLLGERASPFIDEEDVFTSERESLRMLLSLVAHAIGYNDDFRRP